MKTLTFIFALLFLTACGKDNKTGKRSVNMGGGEGLRTDAEIYNVTRTMNGLMVQGNVANFAIPYPTGNYRYNQTKQLVVLNYQDRGPRMKVYNAHGKQIYNGAVVMMDKIVHLDDTAFTAEYLDNMKRPRVLAMNSQGRILVNHLAADRIRAEAKYGVVAVSYKIGAVERVLAMRANGEILIPDTNSFVSPRLEIDQYVLVLRHNGGVEQIPY